MKARIYTTQKQVEKAVQLEAKKQTTEIYDKALKDAAYQMWAVMLCVLHKQFGFGKTRLHQVKDSTEDEFMMMRDGILGKDYTTNDCVKFLKEKFDIDFEYSQYE